MTWTDVSLTYPGQIYNLPREDPQDLANCSHPLPVAFPPCGGVPPGGLTSCSAVALCPVTSLHMMMCSSRITWKEDRMGLQSSTEGRG